MNQLLIKTKEQLERWRSERKNTRESVPENIRQDIRRLMKSLPRPYVCKCLRISSSMTQQWEKKGHGIKKRFNGLPVLVPNVDFREIPLAGIDHGKKVVMEMELPNGARIRIFE